MFYIAPTWHKTIEFTRSRSQSQRRKFDGVSTDGYRPLDINFPSRPTSHSSLSFLELPNESPQQDPFRNSLLPLDSDSIRLPVSQFHPHQQVEPTASRPRAQTPHIQHNP